jgi:hypothetical protein
MPRAPISLSEKRRAAQARAAVVLAGRAALAAAGDESAARQIARAERRTRGSNEQRWMNAPAWAKLAFTTARRNALKRSIPFELTKTDVEILVMRCKGKCEVSGIPFEMDPHPSARRRPFAPSIDRIHSTKGYTRHNVRMICVIANLALNEWGDEALLRLARAVTSTADRRLFNDGEGI